MRIWSRRSQPGDRQPAVTSRGGAMADEAFDDLARAAGESTSRRGALKVLLLGVAGAAVAGGVGGGVLAASASGQRRATTSAQTADITTCNAVIPEQCCTRHQLKACEKAAQNVFVAASRQCAPECKKKNKHSAACKTCANAVAARTFRAYQSCVGQCATASTGTSALLASASVPAGASRRGYSSRQSSPTSHVVLYSADSASADSSPCSSSKLKTCYDRRERDLVLFCLAPAAIGCSLAVATPAIVACVTAVTVCLGKYEAGLHDCNEDAGCPSGTNCTSANVCCPSDLMGCPCASGTTMGCCIDPLTDNDNCGGCGNVCGADKHCFQGHCTCLGSAAPCPPGRDCCGATCCAAAETCCNGTTCCSSGATCCGATCCSSGETCCSGMCCPSGETCCGGACCPAGSCAGGECMSSP
jgi:hypothetical protein